jgi:ABC-type bacteriocin/lantibiotic exporter with double-glycine peptidase domain
MKQKKIIAAIVLIASVATLIAIFWLSQKPHADRILFAWMMNAEYLGRENVVIQTNHNTCGPCALKMIFNHYNIPSSLKEIEQSIKLTEKGSSMLALKEMAELKGLKAEGWRFTLEDFLRSSFPSILYVNKDHYIVADSVSADGNIYLCDPAIGRLRISKEKLNKIWEGETLVFKKKGNVK